MGINELTASLMDTMKEEILLLEQFGRGEELIRECIRESDWEGLEREMSTVSPLSISIEECEERRNMAFYALQKQLGEAHESGFYQVIIHLDPETREACASLYRTLKFSVIRIQGITWGIDAHIRAVSETVGQVLDELFPHRKGKIYSKQGTSQQVFPDPMLVNHSL